MSRRIRSPGRSHTRAMPLGDFRVERQRRAFSLVEMLVVIAVLAILMAMMLPALVNARQHAMTTECLVNCRQCAMAALTYEVDFGRLPVHVAESGSSHLAHAVRSSSFDARIQYEAYMNVDYFRCPFLPVWRPSQATAVNVHTNYVLPAGYFANHHEGEWSSARWIHSGQPWNYEGVPVRVLAMDRSYRFRNPATGVDVNIINHGDARFVIQNVDTPLNRGVARLKDDAVDLRRELGFNAALTDGSARAFGGSEPSVIEVSDRDPMRNGTYLMPSH